MVSTVRKSQASMLAACVRTKARHDECVRCGAGWRPALSSTFRTDVAETGTPRPLSSPTIRLYPQCGVNGAAALTWTLVSQAATASGTADRCTAPPPPTPPTAPTPSDQVDLAIGKTATPTTVVLGQNITWSITVRNASSVAANDANVVKVSERSYRTTLISLTPSQGTCTSTGCDLGDLGQVPSSRLQ
jgi:uncharacterized repeat protein (TIGR01451 family)